MTAPPRFAAVVPAHDGLPDVLDAVESALAQTLPPAEMRGGGRRARPTAPATRSRSASARPAAPVRVLRGRFGGAAAARNAGWRAARRAVGRAASTPTTCGCPDKLARGRGGAGRARRRRRWFFSDGAFRTLDGELHAVVARARTPTCPTPTSARRWPSCSRSTSCSPPRWSCARDALEALGGFDETLTPRRGPRPVDPARARAGRPRPRARALVRYQHRAGGLTRQVEARLGGDVALFRRLAADPGAARAAAARARAGARRSRTTSWRSPALREGRTPTAARRTWRGAWMFPDRALPVALLACAPRACRRRGSRGSARATGPSAGAAPMLRCAAWRCDACARATPAGGPRERRSPDAGPGRAGRRGARAPRAARPRALSGPRLALLGAARSRCSWSACSCCSTTVRPGPAPAGQDPARGRRDRRSILADAALRPAPAADRHAVPGVDAGAAGAGREPAQPAGSSRCSSPARSAGSCAASRSFRRGALDARRSLVLLVASRCRSCAAPRSRPATTYDGAEAGIDLSAPP